MYAALAAVLIILPLPVAGAAQDAVVFSSAAGECRLQLEATPEWNTLRLRVHNPANTACGIDKETVAAALRDAFSQRGLPSADNGYTSLSIGRLVEYPWLSQYLADAARNDPGFDLKKGKPRAKDLNKYVADLLRRDDALKPLSDALDGGGYEISGVSVEKVLVGGSKDIPEYQGEPFSGRAPFDAQVWYRLKRR